MEWFKVIQLPNGSIVPDLPKETLGFLEKKYKNERKFTKIFLEKLSHIKT